MTYREFQEFRVALLKERPDLIDAAETNPWRALAHLIPPVPTIRATHVHRCHLAEAWTRVFNLPSTWSRRALISAGVRHSLSLILPVIASRLQRLQLPVDVYPVYAQLAHAAGVITETFPTIPQLEVPESGDWLLLPNPLKPAGRWLDDRDVLRLKEWLAKEPDRRLLLDLVYTFGKQLHPSTRELLETGQTILLHSLSKGWLHAQVCGVALVPAPDQEALAPAFRNASMEMSHLRSAHHLLNNCEEYPEIVAAEIQRRRARMLQSVPSIVADRLTHSNVLEAPGYLTAVQLNHQELLNRYRLLTAPLTIFGSPREDHCVMSCLAFPAAE